MPELQRAHLLYGATLGGAALVLRYYLRTRHSQERPPQQEDCASRELTVDELEQLLLSQLTEERPSASKRAELSMSGLRIRYEENHGALWIRVGCDSRVPPASLLHNAVDAAVRVQSAKPKAVFVVVSESCLVRGDQVNLGWLKSQHGFCYHHFRPAEGATATGEFVYLADFGGMTPAYATSIEGVTGVVFSPDEGMVLGVWERGGWNCPGGAVDEGEMKIDALARECSEEVNIILDRKFHPVYLGGWQKGRARHGRINDNFSAFAVRATSLQFQADEKEISTAMWLPWNELLDEWRAAGKPTREKNVPLTHAALPRDKKLVSRNLLTWLDHYSQGRGMACTVSSSEVKIGMR